MRLSSELPNLICSTILLSLALCSASFKARAVCWMFFLPFDCYLGVTIGHGSVILISLSGSDSEILQLIFDIGTPVVHNFTLFHQLCHTQ